MIMLPLAGDRLHLYLNGQPMRLVGVGPGASPGAFEIQGRQGRADAGRAGWLITSAASARATISAGARDSLATSYAVKPIRGKAKIASAKAVSPFVLRGFIEGRASDQPSDDRQAI